MSISVLYMPMSLDGYIAGPNDEPGNPGGDEFMRVHDWIGFVGTSPNTKGTGWGAHFMDEGNATGAVLAAQYRHIAARRGPAVPWLPLPIRW